MKYDPNTPHQRGTKAFKELTFREQALSINATIANLEKAIRYHARTGAIHTKRSEKIIRDKCSRQIERLIDRLQ